MTYDEILVFFSICRYCTVHQYIEEVSTCSEDCHSLSFASDKELRNVYSLHVLVQVKMRVV